MENDVFDADDDDFNDAVHSKLVNAVTQLEVKQRVKPSTRNEPSLEVSEFHLVQSGSNRRNAVHLVELAGALGDSASLGDIKKKIRSSKRKSKTLPKPAEKPVANRIDRTVRYDNVKKQLSRWDAVVHTNRISEHLSFPLKQPSVHNVSSSEFLKKFKPQTPLEIEIAEILNEGKPPPEDVNDEKSEFPLTLQELTERRNVLSKLRAKQWYHETKAARQKKIKSKKYHRILRKEKVKEQLKDFEALKKTDPEAALQRLELLDKTRAEERVSLRHRSTGKWARNRAVRAKYDQESRQVLAQQLAVSRELTQKIRRDGSSDEEDDTLAENIENPGDNPWVDNGIVASAEVSQFVNGYRKYRDQQTNKSNEQSNSRILPKTREADNIDDVQNVEDELNTPNIRQESDLEVHTPFNQSTISKNSSNTNSNSRMLKRPSSKRKKELPAKTNSFKVATSDTVDSEPQQKSKKSERYVNKNGLKIMKKHKELKLVATTDNWTVIDILDSEIEISKPKKLKKKVSMKNQVLPMVSVEKMFDDEISKPEKKLKKKVSMKNKVLPMISVEEMFDGIENKFEKKLDKKIKKIKAKMSIADNNSIQGKQKSKNDGLLSSLAFKKQASRPVLDEELTENTERLALSGGSQVINTADSELTRESAARSSGTHVTLDIDPNRFMAIKPKHLKTQLPDLVTAGEDALDDDAERHMTITEAFAEDDVVAEFRKEKDETVSASQSKDIDLSMPGWGSWGGKNLPTRPMGRRGKKRLIIKKPEETPRKDSNKGDVIINEKKDDKIKEHLVNALPFPFTSVQSFEASIRAPIGNTWVPETSFRKMIAPSVQTKLGAIIHPMDEDELVDASKKSTKWL